MENEIAPAVSHTASRSAQGRVAESLSAWLSHATLIVVFTAALITASLDTLGLYRRGGDAYRVGDWLINYAGGFVRRGLSGEVLMWADRVMPGSLLALILGIQLALYLALLALTYVLFRPHLAEHPALLFLALSPATFLFEALNEESFRKELVALVTLGALALAKRSSIAPERLLLMAICVLPALVLSHEALIVFLPFVLILVVGEPRPGIRWMTTLLCGLCLSAFVLALIFSGGKDTASKVLASYDGLVPQASLSVKGRYGAISALGSDTQHGMIHVSSRLFSAKYRYVERYVTAALLVGVAFLLNRKFVARVFAQKDVAFLLTLASGMTAALAFLAVDWGRFLYWLASASALVAVYPPPERKQRGQSPFSLLIPIAAVMFGFAWKLPISAGPLGPGFAKQLTEAPRQPFTKKARSPRRHFPLGAN